MMVFMYAANWKRYIPRLLELDGCTTSEAEKHVDLVTLIASYYVFCVSYPKSSSAPGVLLFIQEILLGQQDVTVKKTMKYISLVNSVACN